MLSHQERRGPRDVELAGLSITLSPLPWALVPLTFEDSSVPTTPELGGMNFLLAHHGFYNRVFFKPLFVLSMGVDEVVSFSFHLELDSISSG